MIWTLAFWWKKSVFTRCIILLPALFRAELYHVHVTSAQLLLPALLSFPSPYLVRKRFVASSSRAWSWVMWQPPTTLVLPSCHHGNVSILTNMLWHPWPSSPIFNPICFSHSIIFSPSSLSFCILSSLLWYILSFTPPLYYNLGWHAFLGICHFVLFQFRVCVFFGEVRPEEHFYIDTLFLFWFVDIVIFSSYTSLCLPPSSPKLWVQIHHQTFLSRLCYAILFYNLNN